jgi:type IX secretion system PorP/SprF family membrane protein
MKYGLCFLLACCFALMKAQDVHFSQFYFSPLSLNPANTGNFNGDHRFFGNYRSQWKEISRAYNTFSAGGDFNFFPGNKQVSAGILAINDLSGGNLGVLKIFPSAAIHFNRNGYKFRIGIQPGIVIKSIDFFANTFPSQLNWDKGEFDNQLPNYENDVTQRFIYPDLNAGVMLSRRFGKFEPEAGFALFHINQPRENFISTNRDRLPSRQMWNAALSYSITGSVIARFNTLYAFTTQTSDWVSALIGEYVLSSDGFFANSIFAGFMWRDGFGRNRDAGIITAGINYSHYTIGFSYDVTFSKLKTSVNSKGAFEVALIYRGKNTRISKLIVPCERY